MARHRSFSFEFKRQVVFEIWRVEWRSLKTPSCLQGLRFVLQLVRTHRQRPSRPSAPAVGHPLTPSVGSIMTMSEFEFALDTGILVLVQGSSLATVMRGVVLSVSGEGAGGSIALASLITSFQDYER